MPENEPKSAARSAAYAPNAEEPLEPSEALADANCVSIIVPCYDAASTLKPALASWQAQRLDGFEIEILIIDNNSTDRSLEIVASTPGVRLLREPEQGAYAARNRGLAEARGAVLVFTDPDCVAEDDWLEKLVAPLHDPGVVISIGRSLLHGRSLALQTLADYEHVKDDLILSGSDATLYYGHTNNMAVRRAVFDAIGPFDARRRGADVICVQRCAAHFGPEAVVYTPEARVEHLEMDGLATYYRKVFTYGWSQALYREVVPSRTANPTKRWGLVGRVARYGGYGFARRMLLAGLMATESVAWWLGQRRAAAGAEPET